MRKLVGAILLMLTLPVAAAELCVTEGESICCHFLCDLYGPISPAGYSTEGFPSCGISGQFSISSSSTDPSQNVGPIPNAQLYLWVRADATYGFREGWGTIEGDLSILSFTPLASGVSWNPALQRVDVNHCVYEDTPLASMFVFETVDLDPGTWGRIKALWR